jgi:hypothetical protein
MATNKQIMKFFTEAYHCTGSLHPAILDETQQSEFVAFWTARTANMPPEIWEDATHCILKSLRSREIPSLAMFVNHIHNMGGGNMRLQEDGSIETEVIL